MEEGEEEEKDAFPSLSSVSVARAESPAELVEESVFVVRSPDDSDVSVVECKRRDGRPLGHGLASDPDEDRRAFRFATADPAVVVHVREIPFSYGKLGGSIWYAAVAFAQYLASNPSLLEGKRVLELGAGLGLPGLVAAKTTGVHVTLSEFGYEGEVNGRLIEEAGEQRLIPSALLDNLRFNIALNNVTAKVRHLDWYDYHHDHNGITSSPPPSTQDDEQYDLLIGSDLVNWEDDVGPLISTLQHFLSATEGSKAIISLSQNNRQALPTFLDLIEHEFVTVDVQNQTVTHFEEYPLLLITLTM